VIDEVCCLRRELGLGEAIEHAFDQVAVGGRALRIGDGVAIMVVGDEIGEGAADIDGNGMGHWAIPAMSRGSSHRCSPASNSYTGFEYASMCPVRSVSRAQCSTRRQVYAVCAGLTALRREAPRSGALQTRDRQGLSGDTRSFGRSR